MIPQSCLQTSSGTRIFSRLSTEETRFREMQAVNSRTRALPFVAFAIRMNRGKGCTRQGWFREKTKRRQRRIELDKASWIFVEDFPYSIGKRCRRRLGLSERLLQFLGLQLKENRPSKAPGLSLPGLPSNFLFQPLQILPRNFIHVVVQGRNYTRSEGSQQPVDESFHNTTFDLVLGVKAIDVSGPASADSLVSSQDTFLVQPIQRRTDRRVRKPASGMKILSDLACGSVSKPDDCPENSCL